MCFLDELLIHVSVALLGLFVLLLPFLSAQILPLHPLPWFTAFRDSAQILLKV